MRKRSATRGDDTGGEGERKKTRVEGGGDKALRATIAEKDAEIAEKDAVIAQMAAALAQQATTLAQKATMVHACAAGHNH